VGWANRLDERVAKRGILLSPRSEVIPIAQGDVYREMGALFRNWRALVVVLASVVAAIIVGPAGFGVLGAGLGAYAASRVRARRRHEIETELAGTGHNEPPSADIHGNYVGRHL
jgi:hypothetical protein